MICKRIVLIGLLLQIFLFGATYIESAKFNQDITIDGQIDEEAWQKAPRYTELITFQPRIGEKMSENTIVYSAYNDQNLYFAFQCFSSNPDQIQATMTSRDRIFNEDWVMVMLDSFNDQQNAYEFIANPYGVQGDLIMENNGDDASPDFVWESAGQKTENGYSVEIAIPLQSIRFEPGENVEMGVAFGRHIPEKSEKGTYPPYSAGEGHLLTQMGRIIYRNLNYDRTYEVLPSITRNYKLSQQDGNFKENLNTTNFGFTTKMGITPTLTLDATYNPDFSQVEADAGQVDANLRSNIYYAEKRPFFMEGSEKFELAGTGSASAIQEAVHTRTIIDPSAGLKLSGKIGKSNSISTIIAADESPMYDDESINENAYFGIFRYKKLLDQGNHIGGIYSSRMLGNGYNHVIGGDSKIQLTGKQSIEGNSLYSVTRAVDSNQVDRAHNIDLDWTYDSKKYYLSLSAHDISKNFGLQSGYLPRDGISALVMGAGRIYYLKNDIVQQFQTGMYNFVQYDKYSNQMEYLLKYKNDFYLTKNTFFQIFGKLSTESYSNKLFRRNGYGAYFRSQPLKQLGVELYHTRGGTPWYDEDDPRQAVNSTYKMELDVNASSSLHSSLSAIRVLVHQSNNNEQLMDYQIYRNRTTYQINKYLFFRATVEYNAYNQELLTDFLASFTYIPGTVVHIGYGSLYEKTRYDGTEYIDSNNFLEMDRGFFMKASYNWRI